MTEPKKLFVADSQVAARQSKTDRLVLTRLLKEAADDNRFTPTIPAEAHQILVRWADLESRGRLAKLKETQLQGDFLAEVFGAALLRKSRERQREVGDELYQHYDERRYALIQHLHFVLKYPVETAIEMAQRLFDRIIFIAFCDDRGLLPEKTIPNAYTVAGFQAVTNPRWQNFKNLFQFIDQGSSAYHFEARSIG